MAKLYFNAMEEWKSGETLGLIHLSGQTLLPHQIKPAFVYGGVFSIGDDTGISNSYFVCQKEIRIGKQVMIGAGCQFYDNDFHPIISEYRVGEKRDDSRTNSKPIIIEDKAFIGANSIILKGSHVGEGSIIGAGSVICGKIPPYEIWAGNPARFIKKAQ